MFHKVFDTINRIPSYNKHLVPIKTTVREFHMSGLPKLMTTVCFYYRSAWFIFRRFIICTPARANRPLIGRPAALGTSRGVSQSMMCRLFSGEVERVKAKWQGKMKSAGSHWPTGYSSFLHPLDLKETHVGVIPDGRIHITTVKRQNNAELTNIFYLSSWIELNTPKT